MAPVTPYESAALIFALAHLAGGNVRLQPSLRLSFTLKASPQTQVIRVLRVCCKFRYPKAH